ncbi:hypothetical protein FIBSPDRAFT_1055836 [Athelia psychrophila]|uniref:G domain-containing protein n=1 Tax=Athelia psychrophila TaxID=1759441 RepID=A0A167T2N8_9AGAM|nr:hypothetical protein FIBSPDRAFT_1055836 [Fibularhizoctonia sp. CBS 109695]
MTRIHTLKISMYVRADQDELIPAVGDFATALRYNTAPAQHKDPTPPFEGVQAPFAQAGSASQSAPALPQEDDEDSRELRERCPRFRTLIIGRANAGKTTILQKVCGTTKKPVVYDAQGEKIKTRRYLMPSSDRGLHDINNTMVFESNPGFIFHDSRGFEAGGAQELDDVTAFLSARSSSTKLKDQVHAVW